MQGKKLCLKNPDRRIFKRRRRMNFEKNESGTTIFVEGRIDSGNAASFEAEMSKIRGENPEGNLTFDCEKLEYVSSSGLRIFLKFAKAEKGREKVKLVNVNSTVHEVLEMTGFLELLDVKKALRRLSVENLELIGEGGNGKVYRIDPETIVKVYKPHVKLSEIERELNCAKQAFMAGISTAISFDIVSCGEGFGVVYEMLDADNLGSKVLKNPSELEIYAKKYTDLAKEMHHTKTAGMGLPDSKEIYLSRIELAKDSYTPEQIEILKRIVAAIPDSETMIHGDYHSKNIMVQGDELILIDMGDMSTGHPIIEVANTCSVFYRMCTNMKERAIPTLGMEAEQGIEFWHKFFGLYFGELPEESKKLIENVCDLMTTLRAVVTSAGKEHMKMVFDIASASLFKNADALIFMLGKINQVYDWSK